MTKRKKKQPIIQYINSNTKNNYFSINKKQFKKIFVKKCFLKIYKICIKEYCQKNFLEEDKILKTVFNNENV